MVCFTMLYVRGELKVAMRKRWVRSSRMRSRTRSGSNVSSVPALSYAD